MLKSPVRSVAAFMALGCALWPSLTWGQGMLLPTDRSLPPMAIRYQRVNVAIADQTAVTRVEQEFSNDASVPLEAFYVFPVPKGAGVNDFALWVNGKRIKAEVVEAGRARQVYEDIVRRTKDPGLLEYMGDNLYRVRVFPVPPKNRQKIELSFSQIVSRDGGVAEYVYPLKAAAPSAKTELDFTVRIELASTAALKSVYSPSHDVGISRDGEHKATVGFEANRYDLSRDFALYWTVDDKDVGLALLTHRSSSGEPGYFLALVSPSSQLASDQRVPRDLVFVADTSGSMLGEKIDQAKRALKHCLKSLHPDDRYGILGFSTTVNEYSRALEPAQTAAVEKACQWVDGLVAAGGTAIADALRSALALRTAESRNFTIVFLTDGLPTIGETQVPAIVKSVKDNNTAQTRIFVFGVGDDVNTHLLDQLADETRAASVYVRPQENLEHKVSSFFAKIAHPVMTNLELSVANPAIRFDESYPPRLPDLFHGSQLVVLGRFQGAGQTAIRLTGKLGAESKEYIFESTLPEEKRENDFVAGLWARRKVGYLLDQIRLGGENKELVDEVVSLAKKFGIATPYTSFLAVPDSADPRTGLSLPAPASPPESRVMGRRDRYFAAEEPRSAGAPGERVEIREAIGGFRATRDGLGIAVNQQRPIDHDERIDMLKRRSRLLREQQGAGAVNVAQALADLKDATANEPAAIRAVGSSQFVAWNGVWIDAAYDDKVHGSSQTTIAYLGEAYFRILELHPEAKRVFALGERIVWVLPSGKVLIVDGAGTDSLKDEEIEAMFQK